MITSSCKTPFAIMGVVNITPDSFSDGGQFLATDAALSHAQQLVQAGADILDLGAESTRPGAQPVPADEEWARLEPVLSQLVQHLPAHVSISVDTRKPMIMRKAVAAGACWINDIAGLADEDTLRHLASQPGVRYIAMHMHKSPETMQHQPLTGEQALAHVERFFAHSAERLRACGFSPEAIYLDPGIGFGKTDRANLLLMAQTPEFAKTYQLVLGVSRKSWLGRCLSIPDPLERDNPSKIAEFALALAGARIIRTHNVAKLAYLRDLYFKAQE